MSTHRPHHHDDATTPAEQHAELPVEPEMPQGDIPPEQPEDIATGQPAAPR